MNRHGPNDTDPRAEAVLLAGYRGMTPAQKVERVRQLTRAVQGLALLDVRRRYPGDSPREHELRVASRWLSPETMHRVFGWDVYEKGY